MHMKNIKDVNVIDGFLLKESYSLYDVDNFKINFINGFLLYIINLQKFLTFIKNYDIVS